MPWYWSELLVNVQDMNALGSGFYTDCKVDKLFTTFGTLASIEGLIEMGSRAAGSIPTYLYLINVFGDPETGSM